MFSLVRGASAGPHHRGLHRPGRSPGTKTLELVSIGKNGGENSTFCVESGFFPARFGAGRLHPAQSVLSAGRGDGERGRVSRPRCTSEFDFASTSEFDFASPSSRERPRVPPCAAQPFAKYSPIPRRGLVRDMCYQLGTLGQPMSGFAFVSWQNPIIINNSNNSNSDGKAASQPRGEDLRPCQSALDQKTRARTSMFSLLDITLQITPFFFDFPF